VKPTSVGRATFPARTRQLTSQALTEGKTVPAVYPRARVRLRAVAVALTVSTSLVVGIGVAPAQAAGPTSTTSSTSSSAASSIAASSISLSAAATPAVTFQAGAATKHKTSTPAKKVAPKVKAAKKTTKKPKVVKKKVVKKKVVKKKKAAPKLAFGTRVVRVASTFRGTPYQYGAAGPSRFDCSGFTRFIFAKFGISLAHSSSAQYSEVRHIANRNKQVGDLVFFHTGSGHVYHVGIYAGGDRIWAATHTGDFVRLEGMWNASYYVGRV
jgi:cell wall-associated NlpC family hydrolase